MDLFSLVMTAILLGGTGLVAWILFSRRHGPPQCIGCGKCVADGICILTGKAVPGMRDRRRGGSPEKEMENTGF